MNRETRGILIGMSLGDGCLFVNKNLACSLPQVNLGIKHSLDQLAYIEHKALLLHSCLGGKCPKVSIVDNGKYPGAYIVKSNKYFRILRKALYPNGKKTITIKILDRITPQGLAIWWMDDGCISMKKRNGKIHARQGFINTYTPLYETQIVCDWLDKRFQVYSRPVFDRKFYRVRLNTESLKTLIPIIRPYIIPSMAYKIDMQYA